VSGSHAAAFDWKTGHPVWQDNKHGRQSGVGIGDYRPDLPGLEVVVLGLSWPLDATAAIPTCSWVNTTTSCEGDAVRLYGWITMTENMNNWPGDGN